MAEELTLWDTSASNAKGTPRWMAPELLSGEIVISTLEADVWSLAMVFFVGVCIRILHYLNPIVL